METLNNETVQTALPDRFVRRWATRTFLGWIFGIIVTLIPFVSIFMIGTSFKFSTSLLNSLALVWVIASVPIFGAAVGYIQWADWLLDYLPRSNWMLASAVSSTFGLLSFLLVINFVAPPTSFINQYGISRLSNTWFIIPIVWGLLVGGSASLPYWYLLSRKGYASKPILTASIGGVLTAFVLAIIFGSLWNVFILARYDFLCLTPIFMGIAIGLTLKNILKRK